MSAHAAAHPTPVGGRLWTRSFAVLVGLALTGGAIALYRFVNGIGSVANLNDGYPWGVWIGIDVVVGTAIGCGGYAVALLAYVLNRGRYHPLVRPAMLTGLLGYGFAALAVVVDLGRFWGLWKVPVFFWRWSHSPQLEVALCVMTYVAVLLVETSPAVLEKFAGDDGPLAGAARTGLRVLDRILPFVLALGVLLPTMHQSSLGTMMLLPGPRVHPLWFTPWLPFLFLVNCLVVGYAVVLLESSFAARAFGRPRHGALLASLGKVAGGVACFWALFRLAEVAWAGELGLVAGTRGACFLIEIALVAAGGLALLSPRGAQETAQIRAAILLLCGGVLFRVDTYLVAFDPGPGWSYFPSVAELLITFGMIAAEVALYVAAVKTFPILSGAPAPARSAS